VSENIGSEGITKIVPSEVNKLLTVIEMEDESTGSYCTSTTRLLKCPVCGTYYYYNHYDDEGGFMDPPCNVITVRRYALLTAITFLEKVMSRTDGVLPHAFNQLTKAFAGGTAPGETRIAGEGLSKNPERAKKELEEVSNRYDRTIEDLIDVLKYDSPGWHIKIYIIESLCNHFLTGGDWKSVRNLLIRHRDPVIRVSTAKLITGVATNDSPVMDLLHMTEELRSSVKKLISRKKHMDELVRVLMDLALAGEGTTLEYDHNFGSSRYCEWGIPSVALYCLVVATESKADFTPLIPELVGMLSRNKSLRHYVSWVIRRLAEKKKKSSQAVLDEIEKIPPSRRARILKDKEVKRLIEECNKKLKKD